MIPNYEESDDKILVPIPRQNFLRHLVSLSMPYLKVREKSEIKLFATPYSELRGKNKNGIWIKSSLAAFSVFRLHKTDESCRSLPRNLTYTCTVKTFKRIQ